MICGETQTTNSKMEQGDEHNNFFKMERPGYVYVYAVHSWIYVCLMCVYEVIINV